MDNMGFFNPFGGGGGGTKDYEKLENLPTINGVEIKGNLSLEDIGLSDIFQIKGRVDTYTDLALIENPEPGWVYLVGLETDPEKEEYVYTDQGTWELIGTSQYVLPVATSNSLGGVIVGSGLSVDANGVLNAQVYNLPIASDTTLGGIKVGAGLGIDNSGVLSNTRTIQEIIAQEVDSLWDSIIPPTSSGDFSVAQAISSGYDDGDFGIATQDT